MKGWALVTGASFGIGRELAVLAAEDGYDLILVARQAAPLQALASQLSIDHGVEGLAFPLDLGAPDGVSRLLEALARRGICPALLINNAGVGVYGLHVDVPLESEQSMIDLNITALTRMTKRLLPGMVARGSGRILNVASTAAFQPGPYMAVYYASKAYVLSYSEALGHELAATGVTVTALCPGPTRTEFQARSRMRAARAQGGGWVRLASAREVARIGYHAMHRDRRVVVAGRANWVASVAVRLIPRRLATAIAAWMSAPVD